jgi:AraC-like DNA-binding protein
METSESVNTIQVFVLMIAAIVLIFWIVWIVRLAVCKSRIKKKNRFIMKKLEELRSDHKMISEYEDLLDSAPGLLHEESLVRHTERAMLRKLENQVRQSKIFLNQKVSRDDLAALVGMERKAFDAAFKAASPDRSPSEWMDWFRVEYAVEKLRVLKHEFRRRKPAADSAADGQARQQTQTQAQTQQDRESRIARIALDSGFSGRRSLNRACRSQTGMSVGEMMKIL